MAMDSYHCTLQIPVSWTPEVFVVRKVIHSFIQLLIGSQFVSSIEIGPGGPK